MTGAFRFGEDEPGMEEATRLDGGLGPVDFDERVNPGDLDSTRVVAAPGQRPMARPAPLAAWRIKGERGLVYEMQSVNAVIAWLEGKREVRTIQLAKADGPFKPVDQYPEIASRLQKRPESPTSAGTGEEPLTLDLSTRPKRTAESPTRPARPAESAPGAARPARAPRGGSSAKALERDQALGFGAVLVTVAGSLVLAGGLVAAGIWVGDVAVPAPRLVPTVSLPPPSPELARALQEVEAGHNTAAVKLLEELQGGSDPRVDRSLALVLHRTGRDREARAALERYRRGMLRVSGDHGRQVREMRD